MKKAKGFTLIELLIVVLILGILAVFVFLALGGVLNRPREANVKNSVGSIRDALEQFISTNETFSGSVNNPSLCGGAGQIPCSTWVRLDGTSNVTNFNNLKNALIAGGVMSIRNQPTHAKSASSTYGVQVFVTAGDETFAVRGDSVISPDNCWYATGQNSNVPQSSTTTGCNTIVAQ